MWVWWLKQQMKCDKSCCLLPFSLAFPSCTSASTGLASFPSRFTIGRPRGEAGAERRREELNTYIWHLIHATPEVAEVGGEPAVNQGGPWALQA